MADNPIYPEVDVKELSRGTNSIVGLSTSTTAFIGACVSGPFNEPVRVFNFVDFERNVGSLSSHGELGYAVRQFFLNGGTDAWVVRVPETALEADWRAGIAALDAVDLFNLLVLPGVFSPPVLAAAAEYCEKRRAFLIIDAPGDVVTAGQMHDWFQSGAVPLSRNAAIYFPWVQIADPSANGTLRWCPPSGTIAGVFARTDSTRGVWKAPAGLDATLVGINGLKVELNAEDTAGLNPLGINCIRHLAVSGFVLWGARTVVGTAQLASDWKYIPVRRLALFVEESLFRGTKWAVFEPNAEPLWSQLRLSIGAFLHSLFRVGAFAGQTPKEAYFLKCDASTTTQNDLDLGVINIVIGFAPMKPAEFVILKLQLRAGQPS